MTAPKSVRIMGVEYPILFKVLGTQHMGEYNSIRGRIRLHKKIDNPDVLASTLVHEILHVVSSESGIDLNESQVTRFGNGWFQVMRDNPILLGFIVNPELETAEEETADA